MRGLRLRETKYYDVDNTSKLTVVSRSLDWSLIAKEMIIATWGWGGGSKEWVWLIQSLKYR